MIISIAHRQFDRANTDLDPSNIDIVRFDEGIVKSIRLRALRLRLQGHSFTPFCTRAERSHIERVTRNAVLCLEGEHEGMLLVIATSFYRIPYHFKSTLL